ncbi:uncharacterized protein E5676_scaffold13G001570 [Cucumis melo var. makuwa]|uniref:DUF7795 domain-containing protein n=1 Tax=Cucumis melo var. makuwa TaxID=1194695 RepID=A0A5D3C4J8_CUCMM|nr:uncharacterized protein E5676_scaffold13G001570 [Cucumis melo var. makuwa]
MEEVKFDHESKEKIFEIFKEFMASVAKLDELGTQGSQLLSGLKQGLELLRRPSINGTSKLIENVIETSNTENLRAYIEAGCINTHDGAQTRSLIDELERLHNDVNIELETENPLCTSTMSDEDLELDEEEATVPSKKLDANDYALLMGIVKVMIKKNHIMQHCCKEETHTIIVHHQREREGDGDATEGELPHCWTNTSPDLRTVG